MSGKRRGARRSVPKTLKELKATVGDRIGNIPPPSSGMISVPAAINLMEDSTNRYYVRIPLDQGFVLKTIVEILRNCVTETDFIVKPDGLYIRGMNDTATLTVNIKLHADQIAGWEFWKEVAVRINIHFLHMITRNIKKRQTVNLYVYEDADGTSFVGIENELGHSSQVRASKLERVVIEEESLNYNSKPGLQIAINSSDYYNMCREMHNLSKTLLFTRHSNVLQISLRENKIIDKTVQFAGADINGLNWHGTTNSKIFQFGHIYSFSKVNGLEDNVNMYYYDEENTCLRIETPIKEYGMFEAYIRPSNNDELVYELPPGVDPV